MTVYLALGVSSIIGLCIITNSVLTYLETASAIEAGLIQEIDTDRIIWVKDEKCQ